MNGNDQNVMIDEERDQKNSTIPESLKNHLGPGSVDPMQGLGKNEGIEEMKVSSSAQDE